MSRPRALVLSQCLPYPPHSGVTNRTFNILRQLQRGFDTTLLAFSRCNHQPDAAAMDSARTALSGYLTEVLPPIRIPSERSRINRFMAHARSMMTGRPYTYYEYWDGGVVRTLRDTVQRLSPDLIHFDSLDLYAYLPFVNDCPVACTHHSIESDLLRSRAQRLKPRWLAPYLSHQGNLLDRVEREVCGELALNVMMSDVDAERLRILAPTARTVVIPNGVDTDSFRPLPEIQEVPGRVTFLGPTYMFPNRDAVDFYLAEIWGQVRNSRADASFELIGKVAPADRVRYESFEAVRCLGYVPDVRPHLAAGACSVVPIRVGGGTRLKILDAWAMGRAVVSTSVGCEGLQTVDGENILIRDEPTLFAEAVVQVLTDDALRARLGANARRTAETSYAWEVIGNQLLGAYCELLDGERGGTGTSAES